MNLQTKYIIQKNKCDNTWCATIHKNEWINNNFFTQHKVQQYQSDNSVNKCDKCMGKSIY